jgi:hypothetical protein
MTLSLQPITIAGDTAAERGLLVFDDSLLVAVLVCLGAQYYGDERGHWHIEIGFGPCSTRPTSYSTLDAALSWIAERLGMDPELGTMHARDYRGDR